MKLLVNSPFGLALTGIRENQRRMRALGYNTWLYKYIAFIVSGAFAGVAGILFVYFNGFISPWFFSASSFLVVLMVIFGGSGTLIGPVIGAFLLILVEYQASILAPGRWHLILGSIFVAAVMLFKGGISVYLTRLWEKRWSRHGSIES
jgi:branched-chain amino acid transport system permease protein